MGSDLRFALRQLRLRPAYAAACIGVLGLGLGVSVAMFTAVSAVIWRPLPYRHASRLMVLQEPRGAVKMFWNVPYGDVRAWQRENHAFSAIAYYTEREGMITRKGAAVGVNEIPASAVLLAALGARPALGRGFAPADVAARAHVMLLSHTFWRRQFGGVPGVVGTWVTYDGRPYRVIGVMPPGFAFPFGMTDGVWTLYLPTAADRSGKGDGLHVIGRLRSGITPAAAQAELTAIQARRAQQLGSLKEVSHVAVEPYRTKLEGGTGPALEALSAAVGLVWLLTCTNVACLLLTGLAGRGPELSVRAAMGAGRWRLAKLLLGESLTLGIGGTLAGGAVAWLLLLALSPAVLSILKLEQLAVNGEALAVLGGLGLATVALVGAAPAFMAAGVRVEHGLHGGPALGGRAGRSRLRDALVATEIALALALAAAAGLMLRTVSALEQQPLGFDGSHVVAASFLFAPGRWQQRNVVVGFYNPVLAALRQDPEIDAAAFSSTVPLNANFHVTGMFGVIGRKITSQSQYPQGNMDLVTAGFSMALRIGLERGRFFNDGRDTPKTPRVAVVNQAFARRYFPGKSPIGRQLKLAQPITIIGVLDNVRDRSVAAPPTPTVYLAISQLTRKAMLYQIGSNFVQLVVRGREPADALIPELRADLRRAAPGAAVMNVVPMRQFIAQGMAAQSLAAHLLSLFGLAALVIAAAGLYGLLAYAVSCRRREIGVRMALGARPGQVLAMVLRQAAGLIALGIAAGLALAFAAGRALSAFLYHVPAHDPWTLAAVALILATTGAAAAYGPARRAARLDPCRALRAE
jgi:predicted permease